MLQVTHLYNGGYLWRISHGDVIKIEAYSIINKSSIHVPYDFHVLNRTGKAFRGEAVAGGAVSGFWFHQSPLWVCEGYRGKLVTSEHTKSLKRGR